MIKEILNTIKGVEIWAIIALFIFIGLFVGVLVWVIRLNKKYIKRMEELPLDDDESINNGEQKNV